MAYTYSKIATYTVGSGGIPSVSFLNIPQTYTDLVVKASIRSSAGGGDCNMIFNGNTAAAYGGKLLYGSGTSAASAGNTGQSKFDWGLGAVNRNVTTSNTFANAEAYIPNYTSSNFKSTSVDSVEENNATAAYSQLVANLWSNTAAITSITLNPSSSGNFVQHSTFHLYGIKAEL